MIAMSSPCTPHRDQSKRILDPSPAFSNYFSDDENSPQSSGILKPSPSQSKLLGRLNAIGRQILRKNPSEHERTVLSAELDALEQTLNAPEPQSREPPDINDSGLFVDDEPVEEAQEKDKRSGLEASVAAAQQQVKDKAQMRDELVARVDRLNREFQKRFEEIKVLTLVTELWFDLKTEDVKHHNNLSIQKLETSAQEILKIRSENHKLRADLHQSHSNFLLLKMQLRGIEVRAGPYIDSTESTELKQSIEQWRSDWKTANERVKSLSEEYEHRANGDINSADSTQTSDLTSSTLATGSPRPRKSLLKIIRPALVAQNKTDLFTSEDTQETKANGVASRGGNEPANQGSTEKTAKCVEFEADDEAEEVVSNADDYKSPWLELWDGLADFAGIYDQ